ncbi:MAG: APC family permease [Emergencia timonensis]|uniref:APC family permease n=1 Tax=Emergencia timonensis TaxID=1776384 RepID=UPI0008358A77|nr:amino acid permease [Emergencia timonensis]WNX88619.1 amino acid permease [Emergencia timonensis]
MKNEKNTNNSTAHFRKDIGLFGGISLVAGMVIGSGIYYLGTTVLERSGMSMGLALLCWIVGGIVSILGGLCFAELGASMPVAGGQTVYLSRAYHPLLGFINGFNLFCINGSGSTAALAIASVAFLDGVMHLSSLTSKLLAILLIAAFTLINLVGVKKASYLQNFTMVFRLLPIVLIIVFGFAMGDVTPDLSLRHAFDGHSGITGAISLVAFATFASLWAFEGWTNMNSVAEELRNPKKNLPLSIIISLGTITIIYTIFNLAIYKVLPMDTISAMMAKGDLYLGSEVAVRLMGNVGYSLVLAGMIVGVLGTLNGGILVFPRTYYAMAKDGYFPKSFAKLNSKGVPANAIIASSVVACILVCLRDLDALVNLVIFFQAALNMLTVIGVLICRKKYPDIERPYKVLGGIPIIMITAALFAILLINQLITDPLNSLIGLVIPVIAVPVYFFFKKRNGGQDYSADNLE